jgi:hypothetical protein
VWPRSALADVSCSNVLSYSNTLCEPTVEQPEQHKRALHTVTVRNTFTTQYASHQYGCAYASVSAIATHPLPPPRQKQQPAVPHNVVQELLNTWRLISTVPDPHAVVALSARPRSSQHNVALVRVQSCSSSGQISLNTDQTAAL